jgi:hypothetical protein
MFVLMLDFKYKNMQLVTINLGHEINTTFIVDQDNCYCL